MADDAERAEPAMPNSMPASVSTLVGTTLGKYRLVEKLGQGGMAQVYKAYQPDLDRYVAVKILHPHLTGDEEFAARFRREARAIAALRIPRSHSTTLASRRSIARLHCQPPNQPRPPKPHPFLLAHGWLDRVQLLWR